MTITFICGSLEKGRDGVGDYTRRLACELIKQGNQVAILALNDRNIDSNIEGSQKLEDVEVKILRLAASESAKNRFGAAKIWIDKLNPEWISLQYVPFSFHNKGFPWRLGKKLSKLGTGKNWHIMFHELWVGMEKKASFKHRVYGDFQKHIIKNTIKELDPKMIHTQTCLYREQLGMLGYNAELLPLFGNIPVVNFQQEINEDCIKIAVFGGIQSGAKLKKMINKLPWINRCKFFFIGNNGPEKSNWIHILNESNIEFIDHGWLENEDVSKALSKCQLGLTSTPYYLTEKSGSAVAMLEHNLTVFCIARNWQPRGISTKHLMNKSIINWEGNLKIENFAEKKCSKSNHNLELISKQFVEALMTNQL